MRILAEGGRYVCVPEPQADLYRVPALSDEGACVGVPQGMKRWRVLYDLAAKFDRSEPSALYRLR